MARKRAHSDPEKGTTVVMTAAALLFILGVAAMAIDLAGLRLDRRADQMAADAAALAGAAYIDPFDGSSADVACKTAWKYALLNLSDEGPVDPDPSCLPFQGACDPATARPPVMGTIGTYEIEIHHPVLGSNPLMGGQAPDHVIDGGPCQRLGVRITRTRDFVFAAALGFDTGQTVVDSVARIGVGLGGGEVVPLLLLEPIACDALYTSGQGRLTVDSYDDSPGFIVIDSSGWKSTNPNVCGSSSWTIDAKGTIQGWIRALPTDDGVLPAILSYALSGDGQTSAARAFDPDDLTAAAVDVDPGDPAFTAFRLYPRPMRAERRITRAPIDWRYNCKATYPVLYPVDLANPPPSGPGITIEPCPTAATSTAYIDELVALYGPAGLPAGFQRWTTEGHPCSVNNGTLTDPAIEVSGDWWVDCPGGLIVNNTKRVTFTGGDVVFEGGIDLRSSGVLEVNVGATDDHVVYLRSGSVTKVSFASIRLERTFAYLAAGVVDLVGGSGGLLWTAPTAGNFEDLALWSESPQRHEIGGQAANQLTGTFFTPLANPFALKGIGTQFQTDAQFLTRRLEIGGDSEVRMQPDPDRQTLIPIREVRLIR